MHVLQVKDPHSYLCVRGAFSGWKDIDGDLLRFPYYTPDRNSKGHRVDPPNAAWYTVHDPPVWTKKSPVPQDWSMSEKSLAKHKMNLMKVCDDNGAEEWQKKLIFAIAMQVESLCSLTNRRGCRRRACMHCGLLLGICRPLQNNNHYKDLLKVFVLITNAWSARKNTLCPVCDFNGAGSRACMIMTG